jgi:hypothetical protein
MTEVLRYRATTAGTLPATPDANVGGVLLPPGQLIQPDGASAPVLWISNDRISDIALLWREVAAKFETHGTWPLVLESLHSDDSRPWLAGELEARRSSSPDAHNAEAVLADWWARAIPEEDEDEEILAVSAPFGRIFPGPAPAMQSVASKSALDDVLAELNGRLGLVSVTRPADAVARLGWQGPINHFSDMGLLSAVLRSWEDRFGAYVVGVGFDTLTLGVERPPTSHAQAIAVAAEHFAACSDSIYQGAGTLDEYAAELIDAEGWTFWWD